VNRFTLYAIAALVLLADQLTKWQVVHTLSPERAVNVVPGYFDLTLVKNTGGAFGIMPHSTWWLVVAAVAAVIAIVVYSVRAPQPLSRILGVALALPLGGALGNLLDRVRLGHVVDFLHAHAGRFDWPVFNVADSCICVGVGLLAIYFWSRPEVPATATSGQATVTEKETV
jgi:signal peptidase II